MKLKDVILLFPKRLNYLIGLILPNKNYFYDTEEKILLVYGEHEVKEVQHRVSMFAPDGNFAIEPIFVLKEDVHE